MNSFSSLTVSSRGDFSRPPRQNSPQTSVGPAHWADSGDGRAVLVNEISKRRVLIRRGGSEKGGVGPLLVTCYLSAAELGRKKPAGMPWHAIAGWHGVRPVGSLPVYALIGTSARRRFATRN